MVLRVYTCIFMYIHVHVYTCTCICMKIQVYSTLHSYGSRRGKEERRESRPTCLSSPACLGPLSDSACTVHAHVLYASVPYTFFHVPCTCTMCTCTHAHLLKVHSESHLSVVFSSEKLSHTGRVLLCYSLNRLVSLIAPALSTLHLMGHYSGLTILKKKKNMRCGTPASDLLSIIQAHCHCRKITLKANHYMVPLKNLSTMGMTLASPWFVWVI